MNQAKELVAFGKVFLSWTKQLRDTLFSFSCFFPAVIQGLEIPTHSFSNESLDIYAALLIPAAEVEAKHLSPWLGS